ncbi:hypothetical protein [Streptomyces sp. NK08204]|uniref:hypothetical protein n=1 Tax=Streptomyces sp. NK08204 TaxID=2873260 RepID=UPI001CEDFFCC|nr:hypothetical protein [Streptomyces sp. NK08204]
MGALFFLLVVLAALITNHVSRSTLRRRGVCVTATCVDRTLGSGGKYAIQMEFLDVHGSLVRRELGIYYSKPPIALGAVADIVYDPENRTSPRFAVDVQSGKWAPVLIGVVSLLVVLVALSLFL